MHVRPQVLLKRRLWEQVGQWWGLVEGRKALLWRLLDGQAPRETVSSKMGGSWPRDSSLVSSLERKPLIQHTSCDLYIGSSLMLTSVWYCLMGGLNEPTSSQGGSDPHQCRGMGKETLVRSYSRVISCPSEVRSDMMQKHVCRERRSHDRWWLQFCVGCMNAYLNCVYVMCELNSLTSCEVWECISPSECMEIDMVKTM